MSPASSSLSAPSSPDSRTAPRTSPTTGGRIRLVVTRRPTLTPRSMVLIQFEAVSVQPFPGHFGEGVRVGADDAPDRTNSLAALHEVLLKHFRAGHLDVP